MLYLGYLQKLGFSEPEAKIFLTLLKFGPKSAADLASKTDIRRTNVYTYTANLSKSGYIDDFEKDGKTLFRAEHPSELRHLLASKVREAENLQTEFLKISPKLEELFQSSSQNTVVRRFVGKKSYSQLMDSIYVHSNIKALYVMVANLVDYAPPPPRFLNHLYTKNISMKLLTNSKDYLEDFRKRDEKRSRETIYLDENFMKIEKEIVIFGDSVAFGDFEKNSLNVTVLSDSQLARMQTTAINWYLSKNSD